MFLFSVSEFALVSHVFFSSQMMFLYMYICE